LGFHVKQWNSWFAKPELWKIDDQPFRHPGQAALASDVTRRVTGFRQNPMCLDSSDGCQARCTIWGHRTWVDGKSPK
jgi:hypothetical protein